MHFSPPARQPWRRSQRQARNWRCTAILAHVTPSDGRSAGRARQTHRKRARHRFLAQCQFILLAADSYGLSKVEVVCHCNITDQGNPLRAVKNARVLPPHAPRPSERRSTLASGFGPHVSLGYRSREAATHISYRSLRQTGHHMHPRHPMFVGFLC
jgi:hypothetical protein